MRYHVEPVPPGQLEPISRLAESIASARTVTEVFRAVFLFAAETSPADGILVALYDRDRGLRRCVYAANIVRRPNGERILEEELDVSRFPPLPLNEGPQSRAIATGRLVHTDDLLKATENLTMTDSGSDFDEKPPRSSVSVPIATDERVLGAFEVQSTRLAAFDRSHHPYLEMSAKLAALAVRDLELMQRERTQHEATLRALGLALEYRDYETKGHTDRVVALSLAFGTQAELGPRSLHALRWGAYLHDLGKVAIPDAILLKPGRLSEEEFARIREHPLIGDRMCADIPFLPIDTRNVVRHHHERWDGGGYPDRLKGEQIPLLARMFALVDVYDALTSERPYKSAWTHEAAMAEIEGQAGRQFDPDLVPVFRRAVDAWRDGATITEEAMAARGQPFPS